ncbi:MAG TPA: polysaccharide biosynthesis/export family protein [Polyangia bacterium]|nr:polysaccharide biosynthesis/export family protein [Polyangia bacterium]
MSTVGCASQQPFVWVQDMPVSLDSAAIIQPRDTIRVVVRDQPALSGEFVVGDQGEYSQPTVGSVAVGGQTTDAVASDLRVKLTGVLARPEVSVSIAKIAPIRVNVVGEVKAPGSYELTRGRGILVALASAGWLSEFADKNRIFVIRKDGNTIQRIRFAAADLTAAEPHAIEFRLRDGDIVVVD